MGHRPAGGADPLHRRHRSGPLAVPGPPAQRQPRGTADYFCTTAEIKSLQSDKVCNMHRIY